MDNHHRKEGEELKELLRNYQNYKNGRSARFMEEEDFERVIDYYDENENYLQALEAAEMATGQFTFSSQLKIKKSAILISLKRYHQSLEELEKASLLDNRDINLYILQTDAFLALDQQQRAAEVLEEAISIFDGEEKLDLLFELADVYDDYENFEKVFDCLRLILEQDPNNEEALYKICFWTEYTGRNEESIRLHKDILDDHPYNELAWFNLGAAYQGLNLYEKAIDAYQYAVAIDEKFDYAYRNMGDAYIRLRNYKDAIEVLQKVLELSRPESVIYEAIGYCFDKLENYAQARFHYKKASHLNPEEPQFHYKVALTYMNEGNFKTAIRNLENAIRLGKLQPDFYLALGKCYLELGSTEEAITHFGHVVRMRPKNINGWVELLHALYVGGLTDDALEYAWFAFEQTDKKPVFLYFVSMFNLELGKSKEGLASLEEALRLAPRQLKKFIALNPAILQNQQVVDLIARYKRKK